MAERKINILRKRMKNRFYYNCAVTSCLNTTMNTNLTFFSLPFETERRLKWLQRVRREDLIGKPAQHARICEVHFDPLSFLASTKRKLLKKNSLPLWVLPGKTYVHKETQTTKTGDCCDYIFQVGIKAERMDEADVLTQSEYTRPQLHDSSASAERMDEDYIITQPGNTQPQLPDRSVNMEEDSVLTQSENAQPQLRDHTYTLPQSSSSEDASTYDDTSEKQTLKTAASKQRIQMKPNENLLRFNDLCDKFLSKSLSEIVKEQYSLNLNGYGNRYSKEYKLFCLRLMYTSPEAYNLLKGTLCLPSKPVIDSLIMPLTVEANNCLLYILKDKISTTPDLDRNCSLIVGTMSLNENLHYHTGEDRIYGLHEINGEQSPEFAKNALVAMVQSISGSYKYIVGYAFLAEGKTVECISVWIDNIIARLFDIGLNVRVMISALTSEFFDFASQRSVTTTTPYFFVGNNIIYYIFDPAHLLTMLHQNLIQHNFQFKTKDSDLEQAKWEYIKQFYLIDKEKKLRIAPELAEEHFQSYNPVSFLPLKVELAVQLFSYSVATGMSTYRDFRVLPTSAGGTIKLIKIISDLFDFLNSSGMTSSQYTSLNCAQDYEICFLKEMIELFASLKLYNSITGQDVTAQAQFIDGFHISLKSMTLLCKDLQRDSPKEYKSNHLKTKTLNRDCLESWFNEILSIVNTRETNHSVHQLSSWQLVKVVQEFIIVNYWKVCDEKKECFGDPRNFILEREKTEKEQEQQVSKDTQTHAIKQENDIEIEEHDLLEAIANQVTAHKSKEQVLINTLTYQSTDQRNMEEKDEPKILKCQHKTRKLGPITNTDFFALHLPKKHALVYLSEFLLKNCSKVMGNTDSEFDEMLFTKGGSYTWYNAYCIDGGKVLKFKPSDEFVNFVAKLEKEFVMLFKQTKINIQILKTLLERTKTDTFALPCECFPIDYCKMLYFRLRIYLTVRSNNDDIITVLKKGNRGFVKILRHNRKFSICEL